MNPVTGASSGFSRLTADALAKAGHTVYALMRDTAGRGREKVAEARSLVDAKSLGQEVRSQTVVLQCPSVC